MTKGNCMLIMKALSFFGWSAVETFSERKSWEIFTHYHPHPFNYLNLYILSKVEYLKSLIVEKMSHISHLVRLSCVLVCSLLLLWTSWSRSFDPMARTAEPSDIIIDLCAEWAQVLRTKNAGAEDVEGPEADDEANTPYYNKYYKETLPPCLLRLI